MNEIYTNKQLLASALQEALKNLPQDIAVAPQRLANTIESIQQASTLFP